MDEAAQPAGSSRRSSARRRRFWLVARQERGRLEVLAAELPGGDKSLPVFSFAEEAALFLDLGAFGSSFADGRSGGGWRVRETDAGELASILLGSHRDVGRVALDPLPGIGVGLVNRLTSMGRERFLRFLLCDTSFGDTGPGMPRRSGS